VYYYAVLLLVGFFGIVAMALSGFVGGHAARGARGPAARGGGRGPTGNASGAKGGRAAGKGGRLGLRGFFTFSTIDLFSFAAGAGFMGLLFRPYWPREQVMIAALIGGIVFDLCVTKVIFWMLSRFVGEPSQGLEGSIAYPGVAVSSFDTNGQGLIRLTLDGQIVQLLATLEAHERQEGVQVRKGDPLMVVEVDAHHNRCSVVRDLAESPPDSPL
jgi:hypothetical protein